MPDDPNKRMDEMLKAYAEERRKAPDVQLHPATRQMLQGEVARVFGKANPARPWWHRLRAFWPQIAFGSSLCVILGIAVLSLRQPNRQPETSDSRDFKTPSPATAEAETIIQRNDPLFSEQQQKLREDVTVQKEFDSAPAAGSQPSPKADRSFDASGIIPPPEPSRSLTRERLLEDQAERPSLGRASAPVELKQERLADSLPAQVLPPARPESATDLSLQKKLATKPEPNASTRRTTQPQPNNKRDESALKVIKTPEPTASTPALIPQKTAATAELTNLGAARRLNFTQVSNNHTPTGARSAAGTVKAAIQPQALLTNFRVEQLGNNVQFVDNDGSIYVGNLEPTNAAAVLAGVEIKNLQAPLGLNDSTAYFFRAAGTNRTLGKDVVVTGNYFAHTNTGPTALDTFAIAPDVKSKQQQQPRHLIIGNATVGGSNQVPLQAVSNEP